MAAATDTSLEAMKRFDDRSRWVVKPGVPVFDEHDAFSKDRLELIAANCNLREKKTGDACPIVIGHTIPGAPEADQPSAVGYARNFRVGTFGPSKKVGILSDFWIKSGSYDAVSKEDWRRSVELWPDELFFDPIALLRRTPKRDLGLLTFGKGKTILLVRNVSFLILVARANGSKI